MIGVMSDTHTSPPNPYHVDSTATFSAGSPSAGSPSTGSPSTGSPSLDSLLPPPLPPTATPPARRNRGLAAGVVTAALLAGAGGGVAGAAAWEAWGPESSSGTINTTGTTRTSTPLTPAPERGTDGSVEQVAEDVLPSVVQINVSGAQGEGSGSGVILTEDGRILTNNHVVEPAGDGGTLSVSFNDGTKADAKVVGTDPLTDSAVIQADGVSGLAPAEIGQSADVRVGQDVVAIGSPYGLDASVTSGIVSALNRPVTVGQDTQGNQITYPAIQTDAAINPGNSGGPLVDMAGRVVGINSSIRSTGSVTGEAGSIGLGFAIPIDELMPIVDQIVAGDTPTHARLGIGLSTAGQSADAVGAEVGEVNAGSAAEGAGLKPGDVITKLNNIQIADSESLIATVRSFRPGDQVEVTFLRDGNEKTTSLTLDSD
jgi:putative serine protease PepD